MIQLEVSSIRAKVNAHYTCQECGSTELIQAHHQIPRDDSSIIVLCAVCHSRKHPDIPLGLFFCKNHQPYWENISASSLAKQYHKHPRTVWRLAGKLGIAKGILSDGDKLLMEQYLLRKPKPKVIKIPRVKKETPPPKVRKYYKGFCPYCNSTHVIKTGKTKDKKRQRFVCVDCAHSCFGESQI